jgi:hypothetical protein
MTLGIQTPQQRRGMCELGDSMALDTMAGRQAIGTWGLILVVDSLAEFTHGGVS